VSRMISNEREPATLRFVTFLSSSAYGVYEYVSQYIGEQLARPTELSVGQSLDALTDEQVDVGFVCGLPFSLMAQHDDAPFELLAAPVLHGKRYRGQPIYFSDIVVRRGSTFTSFDTLGGCTWGYNEEISHSGWNLVCARLYKCGLTPAYFGKMIKTGSHMKSLAMVADGELDAAAIDSHVLDIFRLHHAEQYARLRIIETLGPSGIPPVVVSKSLDGSLKREIQRIILSIHNDPHGVGVLRKGCIERFISVTDEHYQSIRHMYMQVQASLTNANAL